MKEKGKCFDVALMNPPYNKSLHLKFLAKSIEIADEVVNISPVRWLQDPTAKDKKSSDYNKYENSISMHIADLEIISSEKAKTYFSMSGNDLGIYYCKDFGGYDYKQLSNNSIINIVYDYIKNNLCNIELNRKNGWRVRIPLICGGRNGGAKEGVPHLLSLGKLLAFHNGEKDGKPWNDWYLKNQYSKKFTDVIPNSIRFDTENEANNFIKSFSTNFVKYVEDHLITSMCISNIKILYMGNAIHPKTGNIGYIDEWTDNDFIKYFNLTENDKNTINQYIKKFEESVKQWNLEHKNNKRLKKIQTKIIENK